MLSINFNQRVTQQRLECQQRLQLSCYELLGWSTVPAVADDAAPAFILLTNWCYTKMASKEIIIICTLFLIIRPYCLQNIKIGSWLVEDIASQSSIVFAYDWKNPISVVYVFHGSAETLVGKGGKTNHHSIACSLINTSAKNYQNRSICIEVIVCNVSIVFWDTVYVCLFVCPLAYPETTRPNFTKFFNACCLW